MRWSFSRIGADGDRGSPARSLADGRTGGLGGDKNGVPDPAVFAPVGDRSAWESESAAAPAAGEASAAATVVQALARTLRSTSAELTFRREIGYAGEEPGRYETSGSVYPRAGAAESSADRPELLAVRVLDRQWMFTQQVEPAGAGSTGTDAPTWTLYDTGTVPPDSTDRADPLNIFTLLDWVGRLTAAVSTSCADSPSGQRCYLVTVPTQQALTPGTPGYHDAYLHAQDGNESLLLQVAVTDGRLAGIGLDYTFAQVAERSFRSRSSWEFSGYGERPVPAELVAPNHYDEK